MDKVEGFLQVGINESGEVVVNHPDLKPDASGVGHIVFSPDQADQLAHLLMKKAREGRVIIEANKPPPPPVDRTQRCMTDGSPETADHREINPNTGMQKGYVVLSDEERAKGFVRPMRLSYRHVGRAICGIITPVDPNRLGGEQYVCMSKPGHAGTYHHANVVTLPQPDAARLSERGRTVACGTSTQMGQKIAETYALDPKFYSGTFCCECKEHFPVEEFIWDDGSGQVVGS